MKLLGSPALLFLILSLASTLFLNFSSPLFLFSMFNTIIMALILGNYRPPSSAEELVDGGIGWPSSYEDGEGAYEYDNVNKVENDFYSEEEEDDDDDDENEGKGRYSSDGYDEDDDDSGNEGEIGWEDDENDVVDDSLRKRIEEFIAKVNKGWREEWLRDNLDDQSDLG